MPGQGRAQPSLTVWGPPPRYTYSFSFYYITISPCCQHISPKLFSPASKEGAVARASMHRYNSPISDDLQGLHPLLAFPGIFSRFLLIAFRDRLAVLSADARSTGMFSIFAPGPLPITCTILMLVRHTKSYTWGRRMISTLSTEHVYPQKNSPDRSRGRQTSEDYFLT